MVSCHHCAAVFLYEVCENMVETLGHIQSLVLERGFGFIAVQGSTADVFFHCRSLVDLEFDEQLRGRRVTFAVEHHAGKTRATNVRAAE